MCIRGYIIYFCVSYEVLACAELPQSMSSVAANDMSNMENKVYFIRAISNIIVLSRGVLSTR